MQSDKQKSFDDWRSDALAIDLVEFVQARGNRLSRTGSEWVGPCPACGGRDRFSINTRQRIFNCRGAGGGDYIAAVMHIENCDFMEACAAMTGRDAPDAPQNSAPPPKAKAPAPYEAPGPDPKKSKSALGVLKRGVRIQGTLAERYLIGRGVPPTGWDMDIRFIDSLTYMGYEDEDATATTPLGDFPAMVAAIRDHKGSVIGAHRTYLNSDGTKLSNLRGDKRNTAKKMLGNMGGGLIRLSELTGLLVIGEGIETVRSAASLGIGGEGASYASAGSLVNLSGGCTGTVPHPTIQGRVMPNGIPDIEKPGLVLPEGTEEVILLGDGDSDKHVTSAFLMAAGRRFKKQGVKVYYALAPSGLDWNDVLVSGGVGA